MDSVAHTCELKTGIDFGMAEGYLPSCCFVREEFCAPDVGAFEMEKGQEKE